MRHNALGDAYCQSAAEARAYIDQHGGDGVYVSEIDPPENHIGATAEVRENVSGDTVCFIEAPTVDEVRAIVIAAGIEITL